MCETCLNNDFADSFLVIGCSYSLVRNDHLNSRGGGVCLFYDKSVVCTSVLLPDKYGHIELLYVDVSIGCVMQRFILCYNPPNFTLMLLFELCECLELLCNVDYVCTIIGDFNMPNIVWTVLSIQSTNCSTFINFMINNGLSQIVYKPTKDSNILNIALCNDNLAVLGLEFTHPFSTINHVCLTWYSWFPLNDNVPESTHISTLPFNFTKASNNKLTYYFSLINWDKLFSEYYPLDTESLWFAFKAVLFDIISISVSKKHPRAKCKQYTLPKYIYTALQKKKALWRRRFSASGKIAYKCQALKCDKLIHHYHTNIESRIIKSNSVSGFFKYVGKKLNVQHQVAPLRLNNGTIISNDADIANARNVYFAPIFTLITTGSYPSDIHSPTISVSQLVDCSLRSVISALRQAKHTFSSRPDNIPSIFWSKLASV